MDEKKNGLAIVAFVLIILGVITVLADRQQPTPTYAAADLSMSQQLPTATRTPFQPLPTPTAALDLGGDQPSTDEYSWDLKLIDSRYISAEEDPPDRPEDIRLPYDDYVLTQGTHGKAYGDAAIDLAAGRGADILSPINGQVTLRGYDYYGNSILIIENEVWQVKLLHGDFYPQEGDWVGIGKLIGAENNIGNTVDIYGRSCTGRYCGYHTHMNVFDKRTGKNANLVKLLNP